jgi:hypothetical protein
MRGRCFAGTLLFSVQEQNSNDRDDGREKDEQPEQE